MNTQSFSLDDLLREGVRGDELRKGLSQAISDGVTDPALCLQLTLVCKDQNRVGMALWFLGTGLGKAPLGDKQWPSQVGEMLILAAQPDREDIQAELGRFYSALDSLGPDMYEACMGAIVGALALSPEQALRLEAMGVFGASETSLCIKLAVRQFEGDLEAAGVIAQRIMKLPHRNRWTYRALAKLSALKGDFAKTEELCKKAIKRHGPATSIMGEIITALYCQGKKKEAREFRDVLGRATNAEAYFKERVGEVAVWVEQLRQAMDEKLEDGGALFNIGAAVNYTEKSRVAGYWRDHFEECVEENTYRNVNAYTNTVMFDRAEALLAENPEIRKVINYGSLSGVRENALAQRHADCLFAGYDISEIATKMNRQRFKQENLFFDSDFNGLLDDFGKKPGKALLIHCRTADIMFPEALKRVYEKCHSHGVELILSAEYFGFCIGTFDYPDFDAEPVDTMHWDGILVVHNYDKIFPETGYQVVSSKFLPTPLLTETHGKQETLLIRLVLARRMES